MHGFNRNETAGPPAEAEGSLFSKLAEKLGLAAKAATIYGEPVERDGLTVIPVAKARWGLGGGSGRRRHGGQEGLGGGGGVIVKPVGYIEMRAGKSRFRPIWDPSATAALATAGGALVLFVLRRLLRSRP